jgi:two-component system, LuxR family, sensor kinase FixL
VPTIAKPKPTLHRLTGHRNGLRLLLDTALDAVVVMKSDGVVVDWNDRAVDIFGWSRDEAVGQKMANLIIPERYRRAHGDGLRRYLETGEAEILGRRIEVSGLRKNGDEFPVELSVSPFLDGETILFVGCLRDITEHNALRSARVELARVMQMMAMGEMAASIAHEINQPLGAIGTNAAAGLRWLTSPTPNIEEARNALKNIRNDSQRASETIAGIRLMFKKDGQAMAPLDVNQIIREVLTVVRREVETQRVWVRTELFDELPRVRANGAQLRQVIVNLITNAVDAMSTVVNRERTLRIKTEIHESDFLLITVQDSGIGIDPEHIDRIFDTFFTTKSHGMGMGLSICRSIIANHGGHLSVPPGQPHGSIFKVSLPARTAA